MNTEAKPLAKSLHTVTVLVRVANLMKAVGYNAREFSHRERLDMALDHLGYIGAPDPYGLAAAALKQLNAGA